MVYGLVKQSGGYINVYSEVNKGTTIRIYLPQAEPESVASAETDAHEFPLLYGRGETILVVEDDAPVRQLAVSMFTSLGYHPVEADSAKTALKVLEETPQVKLLFTDIVLPGGMSGTDLALQAQQLRPDLKILFTSGYTEQALSNHRQLPEGTELLAKPYRKVNLAKKIHAMLGSDEVEIERL
jgi:CheY-like chemotaxis protein